jgi:hypothetical protein
MEIHDQKQGAAFFLILRARLIKSSATNRILIDCNASGAGIPSMRGAQDATAFLPVTGVAC